jgi:hypothetical protein
LAAGLKTNGQSLEYIRKEMFLFVFFKEHIYPSLMYSLGVYLLSQGGDSQPHRQSSFCSVIATIPIPLRFKGVDLGEDIVCCLISSHVFVTSIVIQMLFSSLFDFCVCWSLFYRMQNE